MCGVPYHSCESYIARLIAKGYKMCIRDRVGEQPPGALHTGLVLRGQAVQPGAELLLHQGQGGLIAEAGLPPVLTAAVQPLPQELGQMCIRDSLLVLSCVDGGATPIFNLRSTFQRRAWAGTAPEMFS